MLIPVFRSSATQTPYTLRPGSSGRRIRETCRALGWHLARGTLGYVELLTLLGIVPAPPMSADLNSPQPGDPGSIDQFKRNVKLQRVHVSMRALQPHLYTVPRWKNAQKPPRSKIRRLPLLKLELLQLLLHCSRNPSSTAAMRTFKIATSAMKAAPSPQGS